MQMWDECAAFSKRVFILYIYSFKHMFQNDKGLENFTGGEWNIKVDIIAPSELTVRHLELIL